MNNRPHLINGEQVFVKRALPRTTASIPERLVVTNRLVLSDSTKYDKQNLRNYFQKLGQITKFNYKRGFIDYDVKIFGFDFRIGIFDFCRIMMMLIVFYLLDHIILKIEKYLSLNLFQLNNKMLKNNLIEL